MIFVFLILFFLVRSAFVLQKTVGYAIEIRAKIEKSANGAEVIADVVYDKGKTAKEKKDLRQRAIVKIEELDTLGKELKSLQPEIETLIRKEVMNLSFFSIFLIIFLGVTVFWKTENQA